MDIFIHLLYFCPPQPRLGAIVCWNAGKVYFIMCTAIGIPLRQPIVIDVPTSGLLAVETKDSFVLWLAKLKKKKTCL